MGTVTISSQHGSGATAIGRALSDALGLGILDRAIPGLVARELAVPLAEALAHDEHVSGRLNAVFAQYAAPLASLGSVVTTWPSDVSEEDFRRSTEAVMQSAAAGLGAVIIGRAGALVLGERSDVLHVRLIGHEQVRVSRVMEADNLTEDHARRRVRETDHAREVYVRHFYRHRWDDINDFHLVLDATAFSVSACVEIIATAAQGRFHSLSVLE